MVAKGKLMKGRAKRLDDIVTFVNRQPEKVDYYDVSDLFRVSPYQARLDLNYLVRKNKVPMEKICGFEEGTNFMGEVIFRHEKRNKNRKK